MELRKGPTWGPVASSFIHSKARVRAIVGPVGSGKSSAAAFALMRMATNTQRGRDGVRRSRSIIVRNTYRELEDSCIKTFFHWVPRGLGSWRPGDMQFTVSVPGEHEHVFMFRAFDSAGDVGKLLSTEYSYAWLSEARELPVELIHMLPARLRYPSQLMAPGFAGRIIVESNPSDLGHWLYLHCVEQRPADWEVFQQPSGLSPDAENVANLPADYYAGLIASRPASWVDCFIHGKWVYHTDDAAVYPEWFASRHVAARPLDVAPGLPVFVGLDFGLTPAAAFIQRAASGQYRVCDEICTDNMGAARFAKEIKHMLATRYRDCPQVEIWGDPAGEQRAQTDESTPYQILAAQGVNATPTVSNDWTTRRESIASLLQASDMRGEAALVVSPTCKILTRGMAGDYRFQRTQVSGTARYSQSPVKSSSSHVCDALAYGLLGAGEDRRVFGDQWDKAMSEKLAAFAGDKPGGFGYQRRRV